MTTSVQKNTPRLIMHVGPGLSRYRSDKEGLDVRATTAALSFMMLEKSRELANMSPYHIIVAPELMREEAKAGEEIMKAFYDALQKPDEPVVSVATFSSHLPNIVLNAVVDVGHGKDIVLCFHDEEQGKYSVHGLTEEGYLENWRFGVLERGIENHFLHELGFKVKRWS